MNKTLNQIREHSNQNNIPIISIPTQNYIEEILNKYKPQNCLEIGGCIGYSGIFISKIIKNRGGSLISFEISYPSYKQALKNINTNDIHNFIIYNHDFLQSPIDRILKQGSIDFVFIDAMKKDYLMFYLNIRQFLAQSHIIIFDDVIKFGDKMENLYGFFNKNQLNYEILKLDEDDGILVVNNFG